MKELAYEDIISVIKAGVKIRLKTKKNTYVVEQAYEDRYCTTSRDPFVVRRFFPYIYRENDENDCPEEGLICPDGKTEIAEGKPLHYLVRHFDYEERGWGNNLSKVTLGKIVQVEFFM